MSTMHTSRTALITGVVMMALGTVAAGCSEKQDPTLPAVGGCYEYRAGGNLLVRDKAEQDATTSCDGPHTFEAVASGPVDGAAERPGFDSDVAADLFARCEDAAEEYLGLPWRAAYTVLMLSLPSDEAWQQGSRWYRCDVAASDHPVVPASARTTGSLRDKVRPIECVLWTDIAGAIGGLDPIDCAEPHNGEFVGVYRVQAGSGEDELARACEDLALDFTARAALEPELTLFGVGLGPRPTPRRQAPCFVLTVDAAAMYSGSLEGIGDEPIPFA